MELVGLLVFIRTQDVRDHQRRQLHLLQGEVGLVHDGDEAGDLLLVVVLLLPARQGGVVEQPGGVEGGSSPHTRVVHVARLRNHNKVLS